MSGDETKNVNTPVSAGVVSVDVGLGDRSRQREALAALFEEEFSRVYGFVYARCGSASIADDVAAETFVDAARAVNAGRGGEVSSPWLFMVARRRLVDRWRADERHRRRLERLRMVRSSRSEAEGSDQIDLIYDDRVLEVLNSLPTRQRAALTLRYLDEYSVSEIAEALDTSYRAAESLLSRARASFAHGYGGTSNE